MTFSCNPFHDNYICSRIPHLPSKVLPLLTTRSTPHRRSVPPPHCKLPHSLIPLPLSLPPHLPRQLAQPLPHPLPLLAPNSLECVFQLVPQRFGSSTWDLGGSMGDGTPDGVIEPVLDELEAELAGVN